MDNRIKIIRTMHDIAQLSEMHNISENIEFGKFRLRIEPASEHRFGTVQFGQYKESQFLTSHWESSAMYIKTARKREQYGTISANMVFVNSVHDGMNKVVVSNFSRDDEYEDVDFHLDIPPELDKEGDIREAFLFQNSVLANYEEMEYLALCYDIAKELDCGEAVMYNDFIKCNETDLGFILENVMKIKEKYVHL